MCVYTSVCVKSKLCLRFVSLNLFSSCAHTGKIPCKINPFLYDATHFVSHLELVKWELQRKDEECDGRSLRIHVKEFSCSRNGTETPTPDQYSDVN